ncbi:hypothetical protein [Acidiphilium iwatense]|uniref:Uncharacterized protein n=1 Tax=Acidiphilium iwatense TaxID=768198 RepID=A0ABS9DXJ3_9PROT|nr:hypothetical protein [Acidiphilium iwatense]MCF3946910.1 hypothetical protein [Acidiphilium iwatense]
MKAFDIKIIAFDKKINRYDDYGGEANRNGAGYRGLAHPSRRRPSILKIAFFEPRRGEAPVRP